MRVLKRVLTRKSILGFGSFMYRDLSVQMIMDLGYENILINSYFGLEKIDFTDDVLIELGITEKFRIEKPGKSDDMKTYFYTSRLENMNEDQKLKYYSHKNKESSIVKSQAKKRSFKYQKDHLRAKNHGNFRK